MPVADDDDVAAVLPPAGDRARAGGAMMALPLAPADIRQAGSATTETATVGTINVTRSFPVCVCGSGFTLSAISGGARDRATGAAPDAPSMSAELR